jgi:predicted phage tail component-like protein
MISLKKVDNGYKIKFELDYIYPTHKHIIKELFNDYMLLTEKKIIIDISKVKIIDISSFKNMFTEIMKLKNTGKDVTIIFPDDKDENYVSRIFELTKFEKK